MLLDQGALWTPDDVGKAYDLSGQRRRPTAHRNALAARVRP